MKGYIIGISIALGIGLLSALYLPGIIQKPEISGWFGVGVKYAEDNREPALYNATSDPLRFADLKDCEIDTSHTKYRCPTTS